MAPAERKTIILEVADFIHANAAELARLDALDAGKPIVDLARRVSPIGRSPFDSGLAVKRSEPRRDAGP